MFRLDYLSCFLTVVATILIGRKNWTGLLLSGLNSAIVCVIGVHTSQYGFIPANIFCICVYAFNIRKWRKLQKCAAAAQASCRPLPSRRPARRLELLALDGEARNGSRGAAFISQAEAVGA